MIVNVIVTVTAQASQLFPAGTVAGLYRYTVGDVVQEDAGLGPIVFSGLDLPAGQHFAEVSLLDAAGNPLGLPVSKAFDVFEQEVKIDVPADIDVSVAFG